MALPSSGQLGINRIRIELGASATNQSLRAFSNTAGFSSPDKITDFYGFTNLTSFLGSALQGGTKNICSANTNITYYHNGSGTTPVVNDIVYTNLFTGVHGNYLKGSIEAQGLDPNNLEVSDSSKMNFSSGASKPKSWKEIWGSGQGISAVKSILPASYLVKRINDEYIKAKKELV